jgi:hypothetical protein
MTCQQNTTAYGTVRPFLDCIPVLRRNLYPADLDKHNRSLQLPICLWVASARNTLLRHVSDSSTMPAPGINSSIPSRPTSSPWYASSSRVEDYHNSATEPCPTAYLTIMFSPQLPSGCSQNLQVRVEIVYSTQRDINVHTR